MQFIELQDKYNIFEFLTESFLGYSIEFFIELAS